MKINIEIINHALVHDQKKIENLNEKELVKKMILRRRLSRASRMLINLANSCEYKKGVMIYGSAYGELIDTVAILESIKNKELVSPTAFQNSVYNTAASYHSIVEENTSEILTLSCGDSTSYNVMQQGALSLLSEDKVFVSAIEAMNFDGVDIFNKCGSELEYGLGFTIKKTDKEVNTKIDSTNQKGVPNSLAWMKNLYDVCQKQELVVVEIEL